MAGSVCDSAEVFGCTQESCAGVARDLVLNDKRNGCIVDSALVCR